DSDLQTKDLYLNSRGDYRWQRTEIGARGNFAQESIFTSEILDTGINDLGGPGVIQPIETDTGELTLLDEHRNRFVVNPYANFTLSPRSSIGIDATYLGVAYSGPQFLGRSDISQKALNTSVTRTIDTRTSASARIFVSDFHAKINDNDTHTVGVEGSIARKLSSIWSFTLATGLERSAFNFVDPSGPPVENAAANFTLDLGFIKHTELTDLSFDLRRSADPSAAGFLTERNELQVLYKRAITQRLTASFAVRAFQTRSLDHSEHVSERNFARGALEIDWAFTPTWSFNVGYNTVSQTFLGERRQNGHANLLSFGVVYRGLARGPQ
ncbi:MAG TPA: hypothetical protein VFY39_09570, partial [Gammaproteobacteria bacterium]|nr:hypothetical protein [Gammaproteobacteria bacterium]